MSTNETMTQISARLSTINRTGRGSVRPMADLSASFLNITADEGTKSTRTAVTPNTNTGSYMQGTKASKYKQVIR